MKAQPVYREWSAMEILRGMEIVLREQNFSPVRLDVMLRKLRKQAKAGTLRFQDLDHEWLFRICTAHLMMHEYDWIGWEFRDSWAARVCTQPGTFRWPRWDGSKSRVLVLAEQGIGDEIWYSSCYPDLAEDVEEAWIECDNRLIPIFERSFPPNLHFISRWLYPERRVVPRISDYWEGFREGLPITHYIPSGNIPKLYRRHIADFPNRHGFLEPDQALVHRWSTRISNEGLKLGVSWKGRQGIVEELQRLKGLSLQYHEMDSHGYLTVPHGVDLSNDIDTVLALIYSLERIVTVPNAVAHLAGASGVRTDVVLPPPIFSTAEDAFHNRCRGDWPKDQNDFYQNVVMWHGYKPWADANKEYVK